MAFIFALLYACVQVGPAVFLRVEFLNEMEMAANSPISKTTGAIRSDLIATAEGFGLALMSEGLTVERNMKLKATVITAKYEIHINFWPDFTYVWNVEDIAEGYLFYVGDR